MAARSRLLSVTVALGLAAMMVSPALARGKAKYKGEVLEFTTGDLVKLRITTKAKQGGALLRTKVKCKPSKSCRFRKLRFDLQRNDEFAYSGAFSLNGQACAVDAYVYPGGFEGTYNCDDGSFGSLSGRGKAGGGR